MKIDKSSYQGYLWFSDQKEPEIINGIFEKEIDDKTNPFIVEGQLFDGSNSISIKYIDGKYIVNIYDINSDNFKNVDFKEVTYLPNFKGGDLLRFRQYWRPQSDTLCEGMDVLHPAELVFVGFDNINKKGE
jgi:CRISPR type III-associated protein (TIGR04423 family)